MAEKYRVAIIGFGHMHINNVAALYNHHAKVEWAACADTVPRVPELRSAPYTRDWNRQNVMKMCGIDAFYDDYREMLAKEEIDIVIITSENALHPDICEACASAGVVMCVEKPMAACMKDALRMARAARAADAALIVNWPFTWMPAGRKIAEVLSSGAIGRVLTYKMRVAHSGPLGLGAHHEGVAETAAPMTGAERAATWWHQSAAGGGAMLDFCGYGAMTSRWYIGEPAIAAVGMRANLDSHWGDADDNGAMLVRYPNAMAVIEGSWTTHHPGISSGPVIYGTSGTLVLDSQEEEQVLSIMRPEKDPEIVAPAPLPAGRTNVVEELIHHLDTGEPVHQTLSADFNLEVMAIVDAGLRSADSGKLETVDHGSWCIG